MEQCAKLFTNVATHKMPKPEKGVYVGGEKRVEKQHEQVNLVLGFKGYSYTHADYFTAGILSAILGGGMSSRLFQEIREKRGLVYSIYAFNSPETDTGTFTVYAGTGEKEVSELMPVLCDELLKLPHSLTEEEIARAKARLKARVLMRTENISTHAEANAIDLIIQGRVVSPEELIEKIESVSQKDLVRVAKAILKTKPTLAALGPIKHVMPYDDIVARLKA